MRRVSNSELAEFRRCRRMWWLKNVRRLAPKDPPSPLRAAEIGTAVHSVLQEYYRGAQSSERQTAILRDLTAARDDVAAQMPESDHADAADRVLAITEGYFDWLAETGADQAVEFLDVEQVLERPLPGTGAVLVGKLDALVRLPTGQAVPLDHKTTGYHLKVRVPYLKRVTQPAHYLWLLQPVVVAREMVLNVLRQSARSERSTGPFYLRDTVRRNAIELEAYEAHAREWVTALLAEESRTDVPPPTPGDDCSWLCPFYAVCPSADNGDDFEGLLQDGYREADPMARYREDDA